MSILEIDQLSVTIGSARLLDNVTLNVREGDWLGVIGPNGAGKSTLLRSIAGLAPYDGSIRLNDVDIESVGARERARTIAMVAQQPTVPPGTPVSDYVLLGRSPHLGLLQRESRHDREVVEDVLAQLGLRAFADRPLTSMSGGELQRVFLARALAQQPRLLLLDEPTSALDIGHQQDVLEMLDILRHDRAVTVISTMHDLTMAGAYAERLVLLDGGRVVADSTPADVLRKDLLESTYGARLAVIDGAGGDHFPAVLPVRRTD